jgi:hypothetical protein
MASSANGGKQMTAYFLIKHKSIPKHLILMLLNVGLQKDLENIFLKTFEIKQN